MARRNSAIELNRQIRGIITEAGPLTFPEDASVDERNFVLNRDGSRQRRLGMDLEEGYELIPVDTYEGYRDTAYSSHRWGNLGDRLSVQLVVVQSGRKLCFFDLAETPLSANKIFEYEIATAPPDKKMSFAVVDDQLVVASGTKDIHIFTYENGAVEVETGRIKIRDLFGVNDLFPFSGPDQIDMRQGNNVGFRPEIELSDHHLYNLRNQTWATMARIYDDEVIDDPIFWFNQETGFTKFPSNADSLLTAYAPMADDTEDRVGNRFHPLASVKEHTGSFPAPKGYFIIDALERGKSRMEELQSWYERQDGTGESGTNPVRYRVGSLPEDRSAGGASVVASYSGRVFYAGFEGVITGGDRHSPKMESMIMFSQLAQDPDNLLKCYQEGDPTSNTEPDLLDTDGGFIPIQGARDIKHMIEFDRYLLVFADNGVWSIAGGGDYGFTATDYRVDKVTSFGCAGADTVVVAGDNLFYWSHDGIYAIGGDQTGRLVSQSLTEQTIQTLFENTNEKQRELCKGEYETAKSRVRWLLYDRDDDLNVTRFYEVIYDKLLQAFYIHEANTILGEQAEATEVLSVTSVEGSGTEEDPGHLEVETVYTDKTTGEKTTKTITANVDDLRELVVTELFDSSGNIIDSTSTDVYLEADFLGADTTSVTPTSAVNNDSNWSEVDSKNAFLATTRIVSTTAPFDGVCSYQITLNWPDPITNIVGTQRIGFIFYDDVGNTTVEYHEVGGVVEGATTATVSASTSFSAVEDIGFTLGNINTTPDVSSISAGGTLIAAGNTAGSGFTGNSGGNLTDVELITLITTTSWETILSNNLDADLFADPDSFEIVYSPDSVSFVTENADSVDLSVDYVLGSDTSTVSVTADEDDVARIAKLKVDIYSEDPFYKLYYDGTTVFCVEPWDTEETGGDVNFTSTALVFDSSTLGSDATLQDCIDFVRSQMPVYSSPTTYEDLIGFRYDGDVNKLSVVCGGPVDGGGYNTSKIGEVAGTVGAVAVGQWWLDLWSGSVWDASGGEVVPPPDCEAESSEVHGVFGDISDNVANTAYEWVDFFSVPGTVDSGSGEPVDDELFTTESSPSSTGYAGGLDLFEGPGRLKSTISSDVTVNGEVVTVNSEDVTVLTVTTTPVERMLYYVTTIQLDTGNSYTFSQYRDTTFYDWKSLTGGTGVDSPAYMISGYFPGEDFQREKAISYVTFHFLKTDDEQDTDGSLIPKSSALVRTAWNWENDNNVGLGTAPFFGNNWSKQYQAYRYRRKGDVNSYDWGQGQTVISSKSKIRGSGKVFSFHIESEPGKDCKLQGWSLIISGAGNV